MIIELMGLPGTGKSYLARSLESKSTMTVVSPVGRVSIVWGAICCSVRYPQVAVAVITLYLRYFEPQVSRYLFINGVLYKMAKYYYAKQRQQALCAEGLVHNLLSLWQREVSLEEAVHDLSMLPMPDILVVLQHDGVRGENTKAYKTREQMMPGRAGEWWSMLNSNFSTLCEALKEKQVPIVFVTRENGLSCINQIVSSAV